MSLQVWLPLISDIHNQGTNNCIPESSGISTNTAGKIGSCQYLSGATTSYINTNYSTNIGTNDFSIAMWLKLPTISSGSYFAICTSKTATAASAGFGIYWNYSQKKFLWSTADGSAGTEIWMATTVDSIVYDKWIHLVMVRDNNDSKKGYFYINGTRYELASVPVIRNITTDTKMHIGKCTNGSYPTKMYINDFRIYDHALSAAEVHEIAQGLVLHYKLDSFQGGYGNPNLLKNSRTFGTGWSGSGTVTQNVFNGFAAKYKDNTSGTSSTDIAVYNSVLTVNPNEVYTVSFWAKADTAHSINCFFYNNTSGVVQSANSIASTGASGTTSDGNTSIALTTEWKYYWITWTFKDSGTAAAKNLLLGRNAKAQSGVSIAMVKLERGSSATPWAPHPDDNEAITAMIQDSSGYGHNGTVTGTLILSSDTPRYSASSQFVAGTKIAGSGFVTSQSPTFTLSYWIHMDGGTYTKWADTVSFTGNKTFRQETSNTAGTSLAWWNYPIGTSSGTGGTTVALNTWTHLAFASDGTNFYFYKNGTLYSTVALTGTAWTPNGNFTLGDASNMFMHLSDFRIYATALSAADILSLYHTGARMDNLNNLHTFSFEEKDDNYSEISLFNGGTYDETTTGKISAAVYSRAISPAPRQTNATINANHYSYIYTTKFSLNNYGDYKITIPTCTITPYPYTYTSTYWRRNGSTYIKVNNTPRYGRFAYIRVYLILYNSNYEELGSELIKSVQYIKTESDSSSLSSDPISLSGTYNFNLPFDFSQYDDIAYGSLKIEMAGNSPDAGTEFSVVQEFSISTPQLLKTGVFINKQIHEQTTDKVQFLSDGTFNIQQAIEV